MDRREAKEIVDWVIAEIYKNRFAYVTDGRLDLSKSHIGAISGTQTYGGPIAAGAIWDRHVELNADIAGTKVRQATTSERGTVELAEDGESAAGLAVQADDSRLVSGSSSVSSVNGLINDVTVSGLGIIMTVENGQVIELSLPDWFDQAVKEGSTPTFSGLILTDELTAPGNLTLAPTGELILGSATGVAQMQTNGLTIGLAAGAPDPDNNAVHIWDGSAGVIDAHGSARLVIETSATALYQQFLSPSNSWQGFIFGDQDNNASGRFLYKHTTNEFTWFISGIERLEYGANTFAFNEATVISTVGELTLDATTNILLAADTRIADTKKLSTGIVDDDYYTLNAVDNDDQSLVEVARVVGAVEPHLLLERAKWGLTVHAADVGHRGFMYFVEGAGGVADKLYAIMKSVGDTYSAVQVAIG